MNETTNIDELNKEENSEEVISEEDISEENTENVENAELLNYTNNELASSYSIIIDGQDSNYLIETYKEMKTTNLYLHLILIAIVLMFVLSKFYYFAKSIFRVRF